MRCYVMTPTRQARDNIRAVGGSVLCAVRAESIIRGQLRSSEGQQWLAVNLEVCASSQ
jgi:hypothetical protein